MARRRWRASIGYLRGSPSRCWTEIWQTEQDCLSQNVPTSGKSRPRPDLRHPGYQTALLELRTRPGWWQWHGCSPCCSRSSRGRSRKRTITGSHGHWINHAGLTDPVSAQWCCNEIDCAPVPAAGIRSTATGYLVVETPAAQSGRHILAVSEPAVQYDTLCERSAAGFITALRSRGSQLESLEVSSLSSRRNIFPTLVFGRVPRNSTCRGIL